MKHYYRAIWPKRLIICQAQLPTRDKLPADEVSFHLLNGWHLQYGRYSATFRVGADALECYSETHKHAWVIRRYHKKENFLGRYYDQYYKEYRC